MMLWQGENRGKGAGEIWFALPTLSVILVYLECLPFGSTVLGFCLRTFHASMKYPQKKEKFLIDLSLPLLFIFSHFIPPSLSNRNEKKEEISPRIEIRVVPMNVRTWLERVRVCVLVQDCASHEPEGVCEPEHNCVVLRGQVEDRSERSESARDDCCSTDGNVAQCVFDQGRLLSD